MFSAPARSLIPPSIHSPWRRRERSTRKNSQTLRRRPRECSEIESVRMENPPLCYWRLPRNPICFWGYFVREKQRLKNPSIEAYGQECFLGALIDRQSDGRFCCLSSVFYRCTEETSKQRTGKKVGTLVALGGIGHPQPSPPPLTPLRDKSRKTRLYKGAATHPHPPPLPRNYQPPGIEKKEELRRWCLLISAGISHNPPSFHHHIIKWVETQGVGGIPLPPPPPSSPISPGGKSPLPSYCLVVVVFVARLKRRRSITLE